jgi:hypothetical protein
MGESGGIETRRCDLMWRFPCGLLISSRRMVRRSSMVLVVGGCGSFERGQGLSGGICRWILVR